MISIYGSRNSITVLTKFRHCILSPSALISPSRSHQILDGLLQPVHLNVTEFSSGCKFILSDRYWQTLFSPLLRLLVCKNSKIVDEEFYELFIRQNTNIDWYVGHIWGYRRAGKNIKSRGIFKRFFFK